MVMAVATKAPPLLSVGALGSWAAMIDAGYQAPRKEWLEETNKRKRNDQEEPTDRTKMSTGRFICKVPKKRRVTSTMEMGRPCGDETKAYPVDYHTGLMGA